MLNNQLKNAILKVLVGKLAFFQQLITRGIPRKSQQSRDLKNKISKHFIYCMHPIYYRKTLGIYELVSISLSL